MLPSWIASESLRILGFRLCRRKTCVLCSLDTFEYRALSCTCYPVMERVVPPSLLIFCSFGIGIGKIPFFLNPAGWNWGGKCHTRSMSYAPLQSKVGYLNIKYATRWVLSRIKRLSQSGFDSNSSRIFQLSWIHLSSSDTPVVFAFWRYLALSAL